MKTSKSKPTQKQSPIWFRVIAVLFGVIPLITGVFFLLAGQLDVFNFIRFFSPIIVLVIGYFILRSVKGNEITNWDYLLLIIILLLAFIFL